MSVLDRCFAFQHPVYGPAMRLITAITNANPAVVTTSFPHNYVSGTIVRLDIPPADGMQQINGMFGPINVLSDTTFSIAIDSTFFDSFAIPAAPPPTTQICAMVVPIGEINSQLTAAVQNQLNSPVI